MLAVNALIEWMGTKEQGLSVIERILWLDEISDITYVINVNSNKLPYARTISEYKEALDTEEAIMLDKDSFSRVVDEALLSEKAKAIRDRAWEAISSIVILEPGIYYPKERAKYVKAVAQKYGLSEKVIYKYLKRYWIRGKIVNALLPDYDQCGGRGKERNAKGVKRGRPRKHADIVGAGINVDEEIKRIFRIAINRFYYSSAKHSLTMTYELMLKEYFNDGHRMVDGKKIRLLKSSFEIPTFGQFRYFFERERNIKREVSSRFSPKKYEQEYRPVLGSSSTDAIGPGSLFQIDATVADVYLVSRFNRTHIIGRPVLYIVQDCFSKLIVGLYVGLEGPSWIGAAMALANTAGNKVSFCSQYGIDIQKEEWPVHHLPQAILADRGEMLSDNAESLIMNLGITVKNTPPFRADWKPLVERYFRLTNERTKSLLPGAVNTDFMQRGGRDYRLDAKLDLMQFTAIIIKCALYHNNHYRITNFNKDEMMVADEVEPIPREVWNWGIANRMGKLRQVDEEVVKLNLMPSDEGVVTAKGIRFKGLFYSSKSSMKEQWFVKARSSGSWKVPVSYDPRNMNYIYIKKSATEFEKCYLLEYQTAFKGKYIEEIEYLMEWEKVQKAKGLDDGLQAKADLITEIETIVEGAKSKTNKELLLTTESDAQRKKNIRQNRQVEKEINREIEAFELDRQPNNKNAEIISLNELEEELPSNPLDLLRRKQREAFGKIRE